MGSSAVRLATLVGTIALSCAAPSESRDPEGVESDQLGEREPTAAARPELSFLIRAAGCARTGKYEQLVADRAAVSGRCVEGFSAADVAAVADRGWVIAALHDIDPAATATGPSGVGPVHLAVLHHSRTALESLANVRTTELDRPAQTGRTPLHFAAIVGDEVEFERLLALDADPRRRDDAGVDADEYRTRRSARTALDVERCEWLAPDSEEGRLLRDWDGYPPRLAIWRADSNGRARQLELAAWADGAVALDVTSTSGERVFLVARASPRELELAFADLRAVGLDTILDRDVRSMHGGFRRIDLWTSTSVRTTGLCEAGRHAWQPECTDPDGAWFVSVWTASSEFIEALVPASLKRLGRDPRFPSFRGYRFDVPSETPWAQVR